MSDQYNYNNYNYNNDFNNSSFKQPSNDNSNNENINSDKSSKGKRKRSAFTANILIAALVVGMAGGAGSYAAINYIDNMYSAADENMTQSETEGSSDIVTATSINSSDSSGQTGNTVADVAESAIKALVNISTTGELTAQSMFGTQVYEYSSAGSGVIINEDDTNLYIATNAHVISTADAIKVEFVDGTELDAQIVGSDTTNDIAVISVPISDITDETKSAISIAAIGDSDELVLGEQVVAIGNALGYGQSVTSGYISAFDRSLTLSDSSGNTIESTGLIQTDASINSGDSGGGLFNMNGELIAINEAKSSRTATGVTVDNMGYAIPMSKALPIIESMINGTYDGSSAQIDSSSAFLGVSVAEITAEASTLYNMPNGLYISNIVDGSPAQQYGLQIGDVITAVDGQTVTTYEELSGYIASKNPGDSMSVTFYRTSNGVYVSSAVDVILGTNE